MARPYDVAVYRTNTDDVSLKAVTVSVAVRKLAATAIMTAQVIPRMHSGIQRARSYLRFCVRLR